MDDDFSGFHAAAGKIEAEKRGAKAGNEKPDTKAEAAAKVKALRGLVDRIVHLSEQKRDIQSDIKTIYDAVKNTTNFNVKAVRVIVKREMENAEQRLVREEIENEVDTLTLALGKFVSTPLGEAAMARASAH
jgi:uncharacterized protein (UPF0335 family)